MIGLALQAIPQKWLAEGVALLVYAAGFTYVGYHYTAKHYEERIAADHAAYQAAAASAAVESARRVQAQAQIAHDAQLQIDSLRADADRARHSADALRMSVNSLVQARSNDAGSPGSGEATATALNLLGRVLGELDERTGQLAEALDRSYAAGKACEQSYDALKK